MQTVLSTKKLSESQRSLLLQAGIGLVEYDAIEIESVDFEVQSTVKNAIITSQNTIKALVLFSGTPKCNLCWEEDKNPRVGLYCSVSMVPLER